MAISKRRPKRVSRSPGEKFGLAIIGAAVVLCSLIGMQRTSTGQSERPEPIVKFANDLDTILIPTPIRPVARGERLADVPLTQIKWPKHRLTDEYLTDLNRYGDYIVNMPLPKFMPIPISSLTNGSVDGNAVIEGIPEGMRAITVKVDSESAVEGWARSGSTVDVIVIRNSSDSEIGLEAKVIAENIKILSAGRTTVTSGAKDSIGQVPSTVTLLVSQEEALKIKTGAQVGRLTFALRGAGDRSPTLAVAMDQKRLLDESKTLSAKDERLNGYAKGPDGKIYVLKQDERWARSNNLPEMIDGVHAAP